MTKPAQTSEARLTARRTGFAGRSMRLILACGLAVIAAPVFAQQAPEAVAASQADDSAVRSLATESMTLSDRALFLATDINRLLGPGKAAAAVEGNEPTTGPIKGVLQRALALLGTPYRWGGASPDKGFDCSGLVSYVFRNAMGIELPRVSRDMAKSGEPISDRTKLSAGDLVFFGRRGRVDHVGIYLGEGRFVHAPRTGKDVMVSSLDSGYWSRKYLQARRVSGI